MKLWIYLLVGIVLSVLFVPMLTAGGDEGKAKANNASFNSENDDRIMKPVVSQTCTSQPAINQILPEDPDSVPGKKTTVWPSDNLHSFENSEMVTKLCGFGISSGVLSDWKNVEKKWQEQYSEDALKTRDFKSIDEGASFRKVKPQTGSAIGAVCNGYYNDPARYCKANPETYPCSNYWIESSAKKSAPSSAEMSIPGF